MVDRSIILILYFSFVIIIAQNKFVQKIIFPLEQKILCKKVLNDLKEYDQLEYEQFTVYYQQKDDTDAQMIARTMNVYYPLLAKDYQMDMKVLQKLKVVIYPTLEELQKVIPIPIQGAMPMGVYYAGAIHILSPEIWILSSSKDAAYIDTFLEQGPLIHELSHYFLDIKTKGTYDLWFSEGVALYYENKYMRFLWREDLKNESRMLDATMLTRQLYEINEALAYRKSFDLISDFVTQFGEEQLQWIIEKQ